jgi:agmatine/peptidylarginine deiminase
MTNKCKMCGEWDKAEQMRRCYPGKKHEWIPMLEPTRNDLDEIKYLAGALLQIAVADVRDGEAIQKVARHVLSDTGYWIFAETYLMDRDAVLDSDLIN